MRQQQPANPISEKITPAARWATIACGWVVLAYAVGLTLEVLGRKFFSTSFKGIDELGGFVLAVSAAIGASYAMAQRSHTRVDVFLVRLPTRLQRSLNTLAMLCFAGFSGFAVWRGVAVLRDTIEFGSSATNLEQPLWVPQALWVAGLGLLALISLVYALHAVYLLVRRRPELNAWYGLHGAQDELDAELANIQARGVTSVTPPSSRTN
ncbi:MAG: TRAP transporter small permease [Rhodoferax sp.]|uniref:TRAP transporter small permease subunit n=1 Tax=Rhodoferax sp. TaxID=50421 RepID=UPI001B66CD7C|nr:TRAP transporter small permease [Rhodoferax sp.]MBP9147534.1 TRAP transporter small permease [Rhodoferax sp.]MBP9735303.1 TRAP transporter small permease [Rhodoferax sp.]